MRPQWPLVVMICLLALFLGVLTRNSVRTYRNHVPRFMNGTTYAESTYVLTLRALNETQALRDYCRQLPWPEDGWIFREWSEDKQVIRWRRLPTGEKFTEYETTPVDSVWIECPECGSVHLRYELRENGGGR